MFSAAESESMSCEVVNSVFDKNEETREMMIHDAIGAEMIQQQLNQSYKSSVEEHVQMKKLENFLSWMIEMMKEVELYGQSSLSWVPWNII